MPQSFTLEGLRARVSFKSADEPRFIDIILGTNCSVTAAAAGDYQNDDIIPSSRIVSSPSLAPVFITKSPLPPKNINGYHNQSSQSQNLKQKPNHKKD